MASESDLDAVLKRFDEMRPRFERAGTAVIDVLNELLSQAGIVCRLSSRVKDTASFRSKVLSRPDYTDPWDDVTDKVGVRALVEVAGDVDRIHDLIKTSRRLPIVTVTDKRRSLRLEELGYSGLHLDLHAPPEEGDTEAIPCELQIRTVAQDAWSVVSHKLLYKPKVELPESDKRALMRLVALVEVFDEEVDRVMTQQRVEMPALPLTEAVAAQYQQFSRNRWSEELTARILAALELVISSPDEEYANALSAYVEVNRDALRALYGEYGAGSAMDTVSDYLLWSQPESLVILHLLDTDRAYTLLDAWNGAGLPLNWLRPIAAHSSSAIEL